MSIIEIHDVGDRELNDAAVLKDIASILILTCREIDQISDLTQKQTSDLKWALQVLLKVADPLANTSMPMQRSIHGDAVANLDGWLRTLRAKIPRLKTAESRARAAVRAVGIPLLDGRGRDLPNESWLEICRLIDVKLWRALKDLPGWCSRRGIALHDVNGAVLLQYEREKAAWRGAKGARQQFLAVVKAMRDVLDDTGLEVPPDLPVPNRGGKRYRFPPHRWAAGLLAEIDAAALSLAEAGLPWTAPHPGARKRISENLFRCASALCIKSEMAPADLRSVDMLCMPENARAVIDFLVDRSQEQRPGRHPEYAYQASCLICELAECWGEVDPSVRDELRQLRLNNAPPFDRELSPDKQAVIFGFLERDTAADLRRLPYETFAEARQTGVHNQSHMRRLVAALGLELGLTLALGPHLLSTCAVRRVDQPPIAGARMEIIQDPDRQTVQVYVARGTRGGERTFPVASGTLGLLHLSTQTVRPRLPGSAACPFLFPGRCGKPMSAATISRAIAELIASRFDLRVTAGQLPAISAALILGSPLGTREDARVRLGRAFLQNDRLLDTIERWLTVRATDAAMRSTHPADYPWERPCH